MSGKLKVVPSDFRSEEIVMTGWLRSDRVVVRMSLRDFGSFLHRENLSVEETRGIASFNHESIESAVERKHSNGEFHPDFLAGR